jgi:Tol biopolymer transport system component
VGTAADYGNIELSPNGDRLAVDITTGRNRDIWMIDLARSVSARLTFDPAADWTPVWSPDGSAIVFASNRSGTQDMYRKASSGVGNEELVIRRDGSEIPVSWSRNGRYIVFSSLKSGPQPGSDTWLLEMAADRKASPFIESPFDKAQARISPDGRWIAYVTDDSGAYQIVVQSFPDPNGGKWQITAQGGIEPKWRRDGRELYYLGFDGRLMSLPVKSDPTFEAGTPTPLFQTPLAVSRTQPPRDRRYDVAADGRFLVAAPEGASSSSVTAIVNWVAGLPKN